MDLDKKETFIPEWARFDADGNPRDKSTVPHLEFVPPTGFEVVEYRRSLATLKDELGIDNANTNRLLEEPDFVDFMLDFAIPRIRAIYNISKGGEPLSWDDQALDEHGLSKREVLLRLGRSGMERTMTLWAIVNYMLTGYTDDEKKTLKSISEDESGPSPRDANAQSAKESTTSD